MSALWTAEDVAAATRGVIAGDWVASGISIDSRTLAPGDLFVALTGPNQDGHAFVGQALERGAAAAVVSRVPEGADDESAARHGRRHPGGARRPRPGRTRPGHGPDRGCHR